jgi:hypothetical protein
MKNNHEDEDINDMIKIIVTPPTLIKNVLISNKLNKWKGNQDEIIITIL